MKHITSPIILIVLAAFSFQAQAIVMNWADWQSSDTNSAYGKIDVNGTLVDVTVSNTNPLNFVQTGSGTNYWTGSAYTQGVVDNNPSASELVSFNQGGTVTITFSQAISNPFIALTSWNRNTVDFGESISFDSNGSGYWGSGTPIINGAGTGFYGSGEVHGLLTLSDDSRTSITFTHTGENWHGMTIGVEALAAVPEPSTLALMIAGLAGIGFSRRSKQKV